MKLFLTETCIRIYIYVLTRVSEPSTLRGIAMLCIGFATAVSPEKMESILIVGSIVVGLLGAITPDSWTKMVNRKIETIQDQTGIQPQEGK